MRSSKLGTLFIVAILALAGLGVVYAGWTDLITVSGTVQTGKVEFSIDEYSGTWVWKHHEDPDGNQLHDKVVHIGPVADTDINGDGKYNDDPHADAVYYYAHPEEWKLISYSYAYEKVTDEEVGFDFVNLYPCIWFYVDFEFTINSIPVILNEAEFTWDSMVPTDWIYDAQGDFGWHILDESGDPIYDPSMGALGVDTVLVQLHPGKTYIWELWIHVAQKNEYQKATASGSGSLGVIQWSDECNGDILPKTIDLPDTTCLKVLYPGTHYGGDYPPDPSYFDTQVWNFNPTGTVYAIVEDGWYDSWCIDTVGTINPGKTYCGVELYSTYPGDETWLPASITEENWGHINHVINHKLDSGPYGWKAVQWAVWYFASGQTHPTVTNPPYTYPGGVTETENMISNAIADPSYVPGPGEMVGVICYKAGMQIIIIEVDP